MGSRQILFYLLAIFGVLSYIYVNSSSSSSDFSVGVGTQRTPRATFVRSGSSHQTQNQRECTVYVAPSSLKGNPGFGLYTTRDLWKGEPVLGGPDGVSIPIEAYSQTDVPKGKKKKKWISVWNPYWWGRGVPDHVAYEAGPDFVDFQIGFGFLPNHHCTLASITSRYPAKYPYDDSMVNRFQSPGAGAFSYNIGREFTARRDVQAGEELFLSYGYCEHGEGPGWTENIYMPAEFKVASDIIWDRIGPSAKNSFEFDRNGNVLFDEIVIKKNNKIKGKLVKELLPSNKTEVQLLLAAPLTRENLPTYIAQTKGLIHRTTDWIVENGMCVETIVARKSTIRDAGQGAFARHSIQKGQLVTFAPLLHVTDRDVLALYDTSGNRRTGTQLLLNYCFANRHSSVLLCPTTNAVLINHCSKRKQQCGTQGPNIDYRWSTGWDETSDEWRRESLEELEKKNARGLSIEFYALRDIAVGDEIFFDYGEEWEEAWENHVKSWKPPVQMVGSEWITAKEANEESGSILPELMLEEGSVSGLVNHPYLFTGCVYWTSSEDSDSAYLNKNSDWTNWDAETVIRKYADDGSRFKYGTTLGYTNHYDGMHWPCTVLWEEDDGSYVVRIHQNPTADVCLWEQNGLPRILLKYSRASIRYFVKPYASDQHLPNVFRYPIGMRDDVFPKQWMNIK